MSMNVRRQLFLQELQRVASLRMVRYSIFRTASSPTNVVCLGQPPSRFPMAPLPT